MKLAKTLLLTLLFTLTGVFTAAQGQTADLPNRADPIVGITSAGQPSAEALESLAKEGYTTVIDLRSAQEDRGFDEAATVEGLGMKYVSLPVSGGAGVTYENAAELDRILSETEGPVLLHCASSNRVGALLSLRAMLQGEDKEEALMLGTSAGLSSLKPIVEELLETGPEKNSTKQ
jgi:uncharacterized protein (TIGR01244 family)